MYKRITFHSSYSKTNGLGLVNLFPIGFKKDLFESVYPHQFWQIVTKSLYNV